MKNKLILCFCLIILSVNLFAGNMEWQPGYIVTNQGDTIRGLVGYQNKVESWTRCYYKASEKDSVVSYFSWEIEACGLDDGLAYESHRIQDQEINAIYLIRCLVKGSVSLYDVSIRKDDFTLYNRYYIVDLIHNRQLYMKPPEEATLPGIGEKRIRTTLKVLFSDNSDIQNDIERYSNRPGELAALFRRYNDLMCNEESCISYVEPPKKRHYWVTPFVGGQMSMFYTENTGKNHFAPLFGVGGGMNLDSQSLRWMMNVELGLTTTESSFRTTWADLNMDIHRYHCEFKAVHLYNNLTFEYRFGNKVRPFIEAGLFQRGIFPTKNSIIGETDGTVSKLIYCNYALGLLGGAGIAIPFGKGNYIPIKLRYYFPFMEKRYYDIDNNMLSLSVGVSFRIK